MRRTIVGLTAGAMLLIAGCSGEADGQAEPTEATSAPASSSPSETSASASSNLPHSGAPAVDNPLPESVLDEHPCDAALTPKQLDDALGEDEIQRERSDSGAGPGCRWSNPERFSSIMAAYGTTTRAGLSASYQNTQPKSAVFQETDPVSGFPAVEFQPSVGSDFCTVAVGLADEYAVTVGVTRSRDNPDSDPCDSAAKVAENVVGNLKGKV